MKLTKKEKFNLAKNLDLSKQINVVGQIIVKDIKEGITKLSKDVNDKPFAPLKSATIIKKGHSKPLLDKGKMKNIYLKEKAKKGSQKAVISMNRRDREIPSVVHNQGLAPQKLREWFGVSVRAVKQANKYINLEINRLLRK